MAVQSRLRHPIEPLRCLLCHESVVDFVRANLSPGDIEGRRILEVGSRDVNGSVRSILMSLGARDYVGVDTEPGPGVDRLCDVVNLASDFSGQSFDVVVTTEMLEHVRNWSNAVSNLKQVVASGGLLVITTRSFGFPYHDFPGDYWRYELDDMHAVFRDFHIVKVIRDPQSPGVFFKGRKPPAFREISTSRFKLFSVVKAKRAEAEDVADEEILAYAKRMKHFVGFAGIGGDPKRILQSTDLAQVGQRDFRNIWQSLERLSDRLKRLGRVELAGAPPPWRQIQKLTCRMLDLLTATRLARGRSFALARKMLLHSAGSSAATDFLRVPWALVDDEPFHEIVNMLESIKSLCEKAHSYAPLSTPD